MKQAVIITLLILLSLAACGYFGPTTDQSLIQTIPAESASETEPGAFVETPSQADANPEDQVIAAGKSFSFNEFNSLLGHAPPSPSKRMDVSPDGRYLAAVGGIETDSADIRDLVQIWCVDDLGTPKYSYRVPGASLESIAFSSNGQMLAVGGCYPGADCDKRSITVFNGLTGDSIGSVELDGSSIDQIEFSPDDQYLYVQQTSSTLSILDWEKGQIAQTLPAGASGANSFAVDPIHQTIMLSPSLVEPGIITHDLNTMAVLSTFPEPHGVIGYGPLVTASPDGKWLAASGCSHMDFEICTGGVVFIYDIGSGDLIRTLPNFSSRLYALQIDPTSTILASADHVGLHFWQKDPPVWFTSPYQAQTTQVYDIDFFGGEGDRFVAMTDKGMVLGKLDQERSSWSYTSLDQWGVNREYMIASNGQGVKLYREPALTGIDFKILSDGVKITIIGGPVFKDGETWWWVTMGDEDGWISERPDWVQFIP